MNIGNQLKGKSKMINFKVFHFMIAAALATSLLGGCISAKTAPMAAATPAPSAPAPTVAPGDADGDGVLDGRDRCPNTLAGVQVDAWGCEIVLQMSDALFEFDSSTLTAQARSILDGEVATLQANPAMMIEVAGHTDSIGSDAYNMELSHQRAQSVVDYLVLKGIDRSRLRAVGYGEGNPVAANQNSDGSDNPQGRALNRRVEIVGM